MTGDFNSNDEILKGRTHYKGKNPYSGYNQEPLKWEYPRKLPTNGDTSITRPNT
jgi:hypothetical protein